jgi:hypothetical protein
MDAALGKIQAQLREKPDDAKLQKQARNLQYQPRTFQFALGAGTAAVLGRWAPRPVFSRLDPYSASDAEFFATILTPSNEGKKPKRPKGERNICIEIDGFLFFRIHFLFILFYLFV